ncbi:MAG: DMT family transporter [Pseudomonadota bacterium]
MNTDAPDKSPEYLLLALLALLWGASYLFLKVALAEIPPVTLIAVRVTIAALFLMLVMRVRSEHMPRDRRSWRMLLIQSFLNAIGAWIILAWGQQFVSAGLGSVLNSTSPIFVFFITLLLTRHEVVSWRKLIGACLGVLGVLVIVGTDALAGLGREVAGQIAVLISAMLYACAAIYGKRFTHLSATATAAGTMIWAMVILVPLSLWIDRPWLLRPSLNAIAAAGLLGLFSTGLALLIYFRLLKTLGSLGTASQSFLRAGVGVLLGITFLGETLTTTLALGVCIAILGVALINWPTARR